MLTTHFVTYTPARLSYGAGVYYSQDHKRRTRRPHRATAHHIGGTEMSTATNAHTANVNTFLAPLEGTDAARLFHEADLGAWDWYYLTEPVEDILWSLCEVLRHYESPDWGNTSGQYGHTGGYLDIDAVLDMAEDDVADGNEDADSPLSDFSDPYAVWTFARWADEHGPDALVALADRAYEVLPWDEDDA